MSSKAWDAALLDRAYRLAKSIGIPLAARELGLTEHALHGKFRREGLHVPKAPYGSTRTAPRKPPDDDFEITEDPVPSEPSERNLDQLSDDDKTLHIVDLIPEAARASGVRPSDCTWADFRAYCSIAWGDSAYGVARRHITRVGGFNRIRDAHFPREVTEFAQERAEITERAQVNRTESRREVSQANYLRQLEEVMTRCMAGRMVPEGKARIKPTHEGNRMVTLLLSDLHIDPGSRIVGFDEAGQCRRLAHLVQQLCSFKPQYRNKTDARIIFNGDLINNWLHGPEGAHPSVQVCSMMDKASQIVAHVAAEYNHLGVYFTPGNHDRDMATDPKRALDNKIRGHILPIYKGVQLACRDLANVTIHPPSAEVYFSQFGMEGMSTHGDTLFGKLTPKSVSTELVEYVTNKFNAAKVDHPVKLVLLGHWHSGMVRHLDSGITVVINGALVPANEYARALDIFEANCGQWLIESTPGYIFGDSRFVRVGHKESQDSSLDGLIKEFREFPV